MPSVTGLIAEDCDIRSEMMPENDKRDFNGKVVWQTFCLAETKCFWPAPAIKFLLMDFEWLASKLTDTVKHNHVVPQNRTAVTFKTCQFHPNDCKNASDIFDGGCEGIRRQIDWSSPGVCQAHLFISRAILHSQSNLGKALGKASDGDRIEHFCRGMVVVPCRAQSYAAERRQHS
jgi:hypothetical protein